MRKKIGDSVLVQGNLNINSKLAQKKAVVELSLEVTKRENKSIFII